MKKLRYLITGVCIIACIGNSACFGNSMSSSMNKITDGRKLNIVIILADDFGSQDAACYGSTYFETPNIDGLASEGMRFTKAYSANPLCSPSRASILTGKNPDRIGITTSWCHMPIQDPFLPEKEEPFHRMVLPEPRTYLPPSEYTLAEAMSDAGYNTVFIGKWHLGRYPHYPENNGFQKNIGGTSWGGPWGGNGYFSPYGNERLEDGPEGEYLTDRLAREAADYIRQHKDEPFFMCYWPYSLHSPYQAKKEYIDYFSKKKDPQGFQNCPTMGGMVKSLDEGVGTVLEALKSNGLEENTIVFFMGDNGPSKGVIDGVPVSSAAPLRDGKASLYEGGVRVPFIVRWPGQVEPNTVSHEVVISTDLYTTALEAAGIRPKPEQSVDSENLIPVLKQSGKLKREAIFWHHPQSHAWESPEKAYSETHVSGSSVRAGDWKLIRRYETHPKNFPDQFELFNLAEDISESRNLADKYPKKVKELNKMINAYLEDTKALVPQPNPAYDKKYDKNN